MMLQITSAIEQKQHEIVQKNKVNLSFTKPKKMLTPLFSSFSSIAEYISISDTLG
jgi:hypothetical protein